MNSESKRNNDLISQKHDIAEEMEILRTSRNRTTIRLFHQSESNNSVTEDGICFFPRTRWWRDMDICSSDTKIN